MKEKRFIEWGKFEKLERKYNDLCQKNKKLNNVIINFKKLPQAVVNHKTKDGLYIVRKYSGSQGIIYLKNTKIRKNHCDCCGKRRKTTAHHLIPKRLKSINRELAQVRIRVCSECESKIHPENGYAESFILKRKDKEVRILRAKLNKKIKNLRKIIIDIFDYRFKQLKGDGKGFVEELKLQGQEKKISHGLKQLSGRLKELKYLKGLVNHSITEYFNKYEKD